MTHFAPPPLWIRPCRRAIPLFPSSVLEMASMYLMVCI
jgi:hypothetical protein